MAEACLISVIVPVYNVCDYVRECIESIQNQTYKNLQILLVDDGSTDGSGEICDEYALADKRIQVIHQKNGGLVRARKAGLREANGRYVGFVDGDDYVEPEMYRSLLDTIEREHADFVHSGYFENGLKVIPYAGKIVDLSCGKEEFLSGAVLGKNRYMTSSIWSKLFRADLIKRSYARVADDRPFGEDFINLIACILECGRKTVLLEDAFYHYRWLDSSMSHKKDGELLADVVYVYEQACMVLQSYGCFETLETDMKSWLLQTLSRIMNTLVPCDAQIPRYRFPDMKLLQEKNVAIYGAGMVGQDYYAQMSRYADCRIAIWVDSCPERYCFPYAEVRKPDALAGLKIDCIVIAVQAERTADEIRAGLTKAGIKPERIFWMPPESLF